MGKAGESLVCSFLEKNGYRIVCRNFTVRGGEIDIIAEKDGITAFVEVKLRKRGALVSGEESITGGKRRSLIYTAERWCLTHECGSSRFDVAVLDEDALGGYKLKYYVSAFDASK